MVTEEPEWVEFDAVVEAVVWGRSVYTIIRLDKALETAALPERVGSRASSTGCPSMSG